MSKIRKNTDFKKLEVVFLTKEYLDSIGSNKDKNEYYLIEKTNHKTCVISDYKGKLQVLNHYWVTKDNHSGINIDRSELNKRKKKLNDEIKKHHYEIGDIVYHSPDYAENFNLNSKDGVHFDKYEIVDIKRSWNESKDVCTLKASNSNKETHLSTSWITKDDSHILKIGNEVKYTKKYLEYFDIKEDVNNSFKIVDIDRKNILIISDKYGVEQNIGPEWIEKIIKKPLINFKKKLF